eukprot:PhF_6_TR38742/c0_g1_i1/m.57996
MSETLCESSSVKAKPSSPFHLGVVTHNVYAHQVIPCAEKYNRIHTFIETVLDSLLDDKVDVICLQELFQPYGVLYYKAKWIESTQDAVDVIIESAKKKGFLYHVRPNHEEDTQCSVLGRIWYHCLSQDSGLIILSKYPLTNPTWKLWRSSTDVGTAKGFLRASVVLPEGYPVVDVFVAHLDAHSSESRLHQIREMFKHAESYMKLGTPVVMTGDMNTSTANILEIVPEMVPLGITDAVGLEVSPTFYTHRKYVQPLDHIWLSEKDFSVEKTLLIDAKSSVCGAISDHYGLYAKLLLK